MTMITSRRFIMSDNSPGNVVWRRLEKSGELSRRISVRVDQSGSIDERRITTAGIRNGLDRTLLIWP